MNLHFPLLFALRLTAAAFTMSAAQAAPVPAPAAGDIFLGVRATAGDGSSESYLVKLGPDTLFRNAGAGTSFDVTGLGNVGADLTATYGADWYNRTDLNWGIFGARNTATTTVYGSRARLSPAQVTAPWPVLNSTDRNPVATAISSVVENVGGYKGREATANSTVATFQPNSSDNSSYAKQVGTPGTTDFGTTSQWSSIEGSFANGPSVAANADGTGTGLSSIGNARNPYLGYTGANIIAGAGIGASTGLGDSTLDFDSFIASYVKGPKGASYLAELSTQLNGQSFDALPEEEQKRIALEVFYLVLRDAGRSNVSAGTATATGAGYSDGFAAIASLFPLSGDGDILTRGRDIRTRSGGDISLFAPGGGLTLANTSIGNPLAPPGIVTESGGNISIFTNNDVSVGVGRIFTLRDGNQIIWSSTGNIAAGSAAKTVQSAPPTRVLIDPQSGAVQTDLAGLATGGGIGVLATVTGVKPGDVDLIAPTGVVDAGDAGIRSSGNLTIAATQVLNAGNIAVSGSSTGTPTAPVVSTPNVGGLTSASTTAGAGTSAAAPTKPTAATPAATTETLPSIINVEVLGYGGGEGGPATGGQEDENEEARRKRARDAAR